MPKPSLHAGQAIAHKTRNRNASVLPPAEAGGSRFARVDRIPTRSEPQSPTPGGLGLAWTPLREASLPGTTDMTSPPPPRGGLEAPFQGGLAAPSFSWGTQKPASSLS